jgi:hypothetical protein
MVSWDVAGNNRRVAAAWVKGWTCYSAAHVGFGPDSRRIAASQRSDAMGHIQTFDQ